MASDAGQETMQNSYDPIVEELIRGLLAETSQPKAAKRTAMEVLTEELLVSLKETERTMPQEASLETILLAEALAPALAEALAPALAEVLAPALIKSVTRVVAPKVAQETAHEQHEGE